MRNGKEAREFSIAICDLSLVSPCSTMLKQVAYRCTPQWVAGHQYRWQQLVILTARLESSWKSKATQAWASRCAITDGNLAASFSHFKLWSSTNSICDLIWRETIFLKNISENISQRIFLKEFFQRKSFWSKFHKLEKPNLKRQHTCYVIDLLRRSVFFTSVYHC